MISLQLLSLDHGSDRTIVINPTIFPDGTSQVWKLPDFVFYEQYTSRTIIWDFENEGELLQVLQLGRLLYRSCVPRPNLYMSYLPYARQDKDVNNDSTFALAVFLDILNKYDIFKVISALDMHSYNHLIQNIQPTKEIKVALEACNPDLICFPDQGASKRGYEIQGLKSFNLDKKRNQSTGEIEGLIYQGKEDLVDKSILICDDICDGGRTFVEANRLLKDLGARKVYLYTTHGLYTKGTSILFGNGIDRIFNKNGEVK